MLGVKILYTYWHRPCIAHQQLTLHSRTVKSLTLCQCQNFGRWNCKGSFYQESLQIISVKILTVRIIRSQVYLVGSVVGWSGRSSTLRVGWSMGRIIRGTSPWIIRSVGQAERGSSGRAISGSSYSWPWWSGRESGGSSLRGLALGSSDGRRSQTGPWWSNRRANCGLKSRSMHPRCLSIFSRWNYRSWGR